MSEPNAVEYCEQHPKQKMIGVCGQCRKRICRECVQSQGYFCSIACRDRSVGEITEEDRLEAAEAAEELKHVTKLGKRVILSILVMVLVVIGIFLWTFVLDPVGKVCWYWQQGVALYETRVLGASGGTAFVRVGKRIVRLSVEDGEELGEIQLPGGNRAFLDVEMLGGDLFLFGDTEMSKFAADGTRVFSAELGARILRRAHHLETKRLLAHVPPAVVVRLDQDDQAAQKKQRLLCLDLEDGKMIWSKGLKENIGVYGVAIGSRHAFAILSIVKEDFTASYALLAVDAATGKMKWQADLPEVPDWGPVLAEDVLLLELKGAIHAFSVDGKELWAVEDIGAFSQKRVIPHGLLAGAGAGEGTACYDLKSGKQLWTSAVSLSDGSLVINKEHIVTLARVPEAVSGNAPVIELPPAYKENEDVLKDFGIDLGKVNKMRTVPVLLCLDATTGKEVWQTRGVVGRLLGDGERLVLVMDTSETSMLQMLGGGKGVTVIRQYDIDDGAQLYSRQSELGFHAPFLVGRRLIGVAYERTEKAGLLNAGMGGGSSPEPAKGLGILAFRMK